MLVKNFSSGFLASAIGPSDTTITITPGHNLPTVVGGVFTAILWNSGGFASPSQDPLAEIVWGQYFSPNTYTIVRGMEGTAPVAHAAGSLIGLYITAGVLSLPYIQVSGREAKGTNGAIASSGAWNTVVLNNLDFDTANLIPGQPSSNIITLPVGTYKVHAVVPFYETGASQSRLYNVDSSVELLPGTSVTANATDSSYSATIPSFIDGIIALPVPTRICIQYQISGSGLIGQYSNFETEIYTVAKFEMVNT